jgi:hypothetical protein
MAKLTFEQYKRKMERWGPKGIAAVERGMEETAERVLAYAKSKHLHKKMPRGVTGGFSGSTLGSKTGMRQRLTKKSEIRGTSVKIKVGTNLTNRGYSYARAHEYGLGRMPERPWLRPSVKAKQSLLLRNIKKAWVEAYGK